MRIENHYCDDDYDSAYKGRLVQNYSYKPPPVFHGEGPVFLGSELEVHVPPNLNNTCAELALDHFGQLAYLKEDGSIGSGFEIVTHPLSYQFAMKNYPWNLLPELSESGAQATNGCGLHVHVNRDGFSSPAHAYRWMKFWYRNSDPIQKIARRRNSTWARFDSDERKQTLKNVKGGRGRERYVAVNCTNRTTYEIRVFASSLNPQEVKAALGLVDATVAYTRGLTSKGIISNNGWDWASFDNWLRKTEDGLYEPLIKETDKLCVS